MSKTPSICTDASRVVAEPLAFSAEAAAAMIGISPVTLRKWRVAGRGPRPTRLSQNLIVYRHADIDQWLREAQRDGETRFGGAA